MLNDPDAHIVPEEREAIEQLLRELPVLPRHVERIPYLAQCLAMYVTFATFDAHARAGRMNFIREVTTKAAEKELARTGKLAAKLAEAIEELSRTSLDAIEQSGVPSPFGMKRELKRLAEACKGKPDGLERAGRPREDVAAAVAARAAGIYRQVTGGPVTVSYRAVDGTRGSEFVCFLDGVYRVLGLDANAAYHAARLRGK